MTDQTQRFYRKKLREEFDRRVSFNRRYSLRAFAKFLKISPNHLSCVLSARKNLSASKAAAVAKILKLSSRDTKAFIASVAVQDQDSLRSKKIVLSPKQFQEIAHWKYFAILNLAKSRDYSCKVRSISGSLGLAENEVAKIVSKLTILGLLDETNGRFRRTTAFFETSTDIPSATIREFHAEISKLAIEINDRSPVSVKDFNSDVLLIDKSKIGVAKQMISDFRIQFEESMESEIGSDVYGFCVNLFPLSVDVENV